MPKSDIYYVYLLNKLNRILPVNNYAKNYLRFSVCDLDLDEEALYDIEVKTIPRDIIIGAYLL